MALVAVGSLCAGRNELPVGTFRQYNIIEIADNYHEARVHVRKMSISTSFSPSNSLPTESGSYLDIKWTPLKDALGQPIDIDKHSINKILLAAEERYNYHNYNETVNLLLPIKNNLPALGRKLFLESLSKLQKWNEIISYIQKPLTIDECLLVVKSMVEEKEFVTAKEFLSKWASTLNLPDIQKKEIDNWIAASRDI